LRCRYSVGGEEDIPVELTVETLGFLGTPPTFAVSKNASHPHQLNTESSLRL